MNLKFKSEDDRACANDFLLAKNVIDNAIDGISALPEVLNDNFIKLIDEIIKIKGRVIVSGIGKSGLIARKISSTLASTGTPSFFVHPTEASHGDLGMLTKDDLVILLSNSGETNEIRDLIAYCKKLPITLAAIIGDRSSRLAKAADINIILPFFQEACSLKMPSTSATMMMVIGDILAVTLINRRNFTIEHYKTLHPGGRIGSIFSKVSDIMHMGDNMPIISDEALISDALIVMSSKRLGCVGIVNHLQQLVGIICDGDIRRNMGPQLIHHPVTKIMTKNPKTINAGCFVSEAIDLMNECSITVVFILEKKIPIGVLHIHDCLHIK